MCIYLYVSLFMIFFFFKQKTAYEMRISDWSSDVCSSDLQPWKKNGKIQKIILFGSYGRGDWVDDPENGYQSDFDLLIIVSHANLTDIAEYWYVAEDKILRDAAIARPVNIIVHTLEEVNRGLHRGEYFWVDLQSEERRVG